MSDTAIQVEGLGKRYLIQHLRQRQREHRYTSRPAASNNAR